MHILNTISSLTHFWRSCDAKLFIFTHCLNKYNQNYRPNDFIKWIVHQNLQDNLIFEFSITETILLLKE